MYKKINLITTKPKFFNFINIKSNIKLNIKIKSEFVGEILNVPFNFNIQFLNSWDKEVVNIISNINGVWCIGGAPLALYTNKVSQLNDWDIFIENKQSLNNITEVLKYSGFRKISEIGYLENWIKGSYNSCKIQLITKYIDRSDFIGSIFNGFDISVCQIGFTNIDKFFLSSKAKYDIENKMFNLLLKTKNTNDRIEKYKSKGYSLNEDSLKTAVDGSELY